MKKKKKKSEGDCMTLSKKRKTERRLEHGRTDEPEENRDRE